MLLNNPGIKEKILREILKNILNKNENTTYQNSWEFQLCKLSSGDLMYSKMIMVNNTVLYAWFAKKVDLKCSHHKEKKMVTM